MDALTQISLYLGILGSIASLIGIPLALRSLKLSKIAAREALAAKDSAQNTAEEVRKARRDLRLVTSVGTLQRILTVIEDLKTFVRNNTLGVVPERISNLIQELNDLRSAESSLTNDDLAHVQGVISALRKIETSIDNSRGEDDKKAKGLTTKLSKQIDTLQPILVRLRESIGAPS